MPEFKSERLIDTIALRYGCSIGKCEFSKEYYLSKKYVIDIDYEKRKVFYLSSIDKNIIELPNNNRNLQNDISTIFLFGNEKFLHLCDTVVFIKNFSSFFEMNLNHLINNKYILFGLVDDDDIKEKYSNCEIVEI